MKIDLEIFGTSSVVHYADRAAKHRIAGVNSAKRTKMTRRKGHIIFQCTRCSNEYDSKSNAWKTAWASAKEKGWPQMDKAAKNSY